MYDKNGVHSTQGCVTEKIENPQLTADSATSFTSLSRINSHTHVHQFVACRGTRFAGQKSFVRDV